MNAPERSIICGIAKISIGIEWFFDTQAVVLHQVPLLAFFGDQPPFPYGNDPFLIIHIVSVASEEVEQELSQCFGIWPAEAAKPIKVVVEPNAPTIRAGPEFMRFLMKRR